LEVYIFANEKILPPSASISDPFLFWQPQKKNRCREKGMDEEGEKDKKWRQSTGSQDQPRSQGRGGGVMRWLGVVVVVCCSSQPMLPRSPAPHAS